MVTQQSPFKAPLLILFSLSLICLGCAEDEESPSNSLELPLLHTPTEAHPLNKNQGWNLHNQPHLSLVSYISFSPSYRLAFPNLKVSRHCHIGVKNDTFTIKTPKHFPMVALLHRPHTSKQPLPCTIHVEGFGEHTRHTLIYEKTLHFLLPYEEHLKTFKTVELTDFKTSAQPLTHEPSFGLKLYSQKSQFGQIDYLGVTLSKLNWENISAQMQCNRGTYGETHHKQKAFYYYDDSTTCKVETCFLFERDYFPNSDPEKPPVLLYTSVSQALYKKSTCFDQ